MEEAGRSVGGVTRELATPSPNLTAVLSECLRGAGKEGRQRGSFTGTREPSKPGVTVWQLQGL